MQLRKAPDLVSALAASSQFHLRSQCMKCRSLSIKLPMEDGEIAILASVVQVLTSQAHRTILKHTFVAGFILHYLL